jgi:hypothetical protein
MYWDSYIIRSFYNNGGNVILNINITFPPIIIERSDDVAVPVHIFNITFPPLL